jgi:predicted GTPase
MTGGKDFQLIDTPGIDEGDDADKQHIKEIYNTLKKETPYVKQFVLVTNGSLRFDSGTTLKILTVFERTFSPEFWKYLRIVVTRYSNEAKAVNKRANSGVTKESKKRGIVETLA